VLGTQVIFHHDWVPYDERADWLLDANCAISTHLDHLETRFAYRSRLVDCFWAGLPVVCTTGDALALRIERDGLGATAPPGDDAALANALDGVLSRGRRAYAAPLAAAAIADCWSAVAEPVVRWVTASEQRRRLGDWVPGPMSGSVFAAARTHGYRAVRSLLQGRRRRPDG
jgi:glycosyltransferase involved in cell wall biosynthesis